MTSTFWIKTDQLDPEQQQAVQGMPQSASFLIRGPAGSGKTNILLLRAKWLVLKRVGNIKIVVFTKSLREFMVQGCIQYGIDPAIPVTQMSFFRSILEEYSVPFESSGEFETDRMLLAGQVMSLINEKRISNNYCSALLIDETQDYTDTEILAFKGLAQSLVLAIDSRQSIYNVTHTSNLPDTLVNNQIIELRYHYRSGLRLCKVADAILADSVAYPRLQFDCQYPESELPSSVVRMSCVTLEEQFELIMKNLSLQIELYPGEPIGVLFPKREQVIKFEQYFQFNSSLEMSDKIKIDTLHGAKGWEFRAVHLGGCEMLYRMGSVQKRLIYTGVLRGKTSAHLYFSGHIPGFLESALAVLEPPVAAPKLDDLF